MEICSLRDAATHIRDLGAEIYGISLDDVQSQAAFAEAQELDYPLLSDPDGGVALKYGALAPNGRFSRRVTFVIDDQGIVRAIDEKVEVKTHGSQLAELLEGLMD